MRARPFGLGVDRATPQCSLPSLLGPERLGNPHKGVCVRQPDWRRFFFFMMMSVWTEGWAQGRDLIKSSATDDHMQFSQQAWCFGHIGPYGENSLRSDQTATNSSRRQNTILVTFC